MLAVDGHKLGAGLFDRAHEHGASRHEAFLVGESQPAPHAGGGKRRLEPRRSDNGGHDAIDWPLRGLDERSLPRRRLRYRFQRAAP